MRFVHSLDDSVLVHIAGGLTAVVAAATALFSGHALFGGRSEVASPPPPPDVVEEMGYSDPDSDPPMWYIASATAGRDTGSGSDSGTSTATPLCDRVRTKEADVDTMNEHIDGLLTEVKARQVQRRR